ncbi:MAG: DNA repair protein RadC [Prevotellaceae bacterium]|nr:DNA repair protein RadC [Candidatus Faecinaster equi]
MHGINTWSEDSRPRERLLAHGAAALSNAELLAILIQSGSPEKDAVTLMTEILNDCHNDLSVFGKMTFEELTKYKGIGEAKAITLMAACEFATRRMKKESKEVAAFKTSLDIYNFFLPRICELKYEKTFVLLLNKKLHYVDDRILAEGGIDMTPVDPKKILNYVISKNAPVFVLAHNHPSGDPTPSNLDNQVTRRMRDAADILGVKMIDHIIVCDNGRYYSYNDNGQ